MATVDCMARRQLSIAGGRFEKSGHQRKTDCRAFVAKHLSGPVNARCALARWAVRHVRIVVLNALGRMLKARMYRSLTGHRAGKMS